MVSSSNQLQVPGDTPGERVRWARHQKNLTIEDVSKATGLSETFLINVENGKAAFSATTAKMLAEVLKQPIWFIGYYENLPTDTLGQRITKARLYRGLTKRELAACLDVHEKTIKIWEDDACQPTNNIMKRIAPLLTF